MSIIDTFKKYILAILILIIVGLGSAGYFLVYPKYQDYKAVKTEFEFKDEEMRAKENYLPKLESISEKLTEVSNKINIIESALPSNPSIAALYEYLKIMIPENGMIVNKINIEGLFSESEESQEKVKEMLFSVEVAGSYESFKLLLSELYLISRIIKVDSFKLSSSESEAGPDTFTFDLQLKTQSYNNKIQEGMVDNPMMETPSI
ncbi:type 4a pilus biogenesis protein PilO [Patescibacteria group bacterium]|nr:type 4a pilus biogenesis protein PilO [Patescibacteria group bacterium]